MVKKALVIGINAYPSPNALPSCVGDADAFSDMLQSNHGFTAISNLRDAQATREGILSGIKALVGGAQNDDELVFYYSGHGYSFQQGDTHTDSLVAQDCQFLTVDDFNSAVGAVPVGRLTVVLDSCFSGGMQKAFALFDGVKPVQIKFFQPLDAEERQKAFDTTRPPIRVMKSFGSADAEAMPSSFMSLVAEKGFSIVEPPATGIDRKFLLVSACRGDETAAASTERTAGLSAFTFSFLRQIGLDGARAGIATVLDETGQMLRGLGIAQTPMLKVPSQPADLVQRTFLHWDQPAPERQGATSFALAALSLSDGLTNKGFSMTSALDFPSSDIASIVRATAPAAAASIKSFGATKDFSPSVPPGMDKAWFDDLTRTIATVIPAVLQGMKSMPPPTKGYGNAPQPFDKGWLDDLVSVAVAVVPPVVSALKDYRGPDASNAALASAAQKGFFDDLTHVVANVLPVVLSAVKSMPAGATTKGFNPSSGGQAIEAKSFWDTLGSIAQVAVPIVLATI